MSRRGSTATGGALLAGLLLAATLTGCSDDPEAKAAGSPPPPPSEVPQSAEPSVPAAKTAQGSRGLRTPVKYPDKITVEITSIRYVKNPEEGPGEIKGRLLTIFTLRFQNGSAQPLDLNKVRVVARYGDRRTEASPTSYANLNDFYGVAAPGQSRTAAYAFDLPHAGYKSVILGVRFDDKHKTAVFAGSLRP